MTTVKARVMRIGRRRPTLGHATATTRFSMCTLSHVTYPRGARFREHSHDRTYLCLVLAGGFREQVGRETRIAEPGSVVVMPAGQRHSDVIADDGARSLVLTLEPDAADAARFVRSGIQDCGPLARTMMGLLLAERAGTLDELAVEEHVRLAACIVFGEVERPYGARPAVVARAVEYLEAHRTERLRLGEVAIAVGVDRSYLARVFRRSTGRTLSEHRRASRVRWAARLVAAGAALATVAADTGFADQSHLTRCFLEELGLTPGRFRAVVGGARHRSGTSA